MKPTTVPLIRAIVAAGVIGVSVAPVLGQGIAGQAQTLPTIRIGVGGHAVTAEVAKTPAERQTGLMYRFSLAPDRGMLFVFAESEARGFWMKNTYIPLSIAFIDAGGRIANIEDMAPHDEATHQSRGPVLYALEMRKGWFAERGIAAGAQVTGLPPAAAR